MAKLEQFKKNDPRINREGRPKGSKSLTTKMREALDRIDKKTGTQNDELLIASILKDAIKADGQSRRLILQYLEGMPHQSQDLRHSGSMEITGVDITIRK